MAKSAPAFQFYPADFVGGTMHLDLDAIGAYALLLCRQWMDGSLPAEPKKLAHICKKNINDFMPVWDEIKDKFVDVAEGRLINSRLESVRESQLALREKRSHSGAKGGLAKAKQMPKQKHSKGSMKNEDRRLEIESRKRDDDAFEIWWDLVPRKTKKPLARTAYGKALQVLRGRGVDDPYGHLAERMRAFSRSETAKGKYCPYPSTWLNQEQYDDDDAAWRSTANDVDPRGVGSAAQAYMELENGHKT